MSARAAARILCVDDEPNVLEGYRRHLRRGYQVHVACGGDEALQRLDEAPFAVVVSDLRMPGVDGIALLKEVRRRSPDTVRMMLTGYGDIDVVTKAVNEGHIFRFLTKPCPPDTLMSALDSGVRQYELVTAERDLLEKTLNGSIQVLTEILSLVDPTIFGEATALREAALKVAESMGVQERWDIELAAMFARVGCVTLPPDLIRRRRRGERLRTDEEELAARVPEIGANLLAHIPRLGDVARIVQFHERSYDGDAAGGPAGADLPLGSRILRVLVDLFDLEGRGIARAEAFERLKSQRVRYDEQVLAAVEACLVRPDAADRTDAASRAIGFAQLASGQYLLSDVVSLDGQLLISKGRVITPALLERLRNFGKLKGVREPIQVAQEAPPA